MLLQKLSITKINLFILVCLLLAKTTAYGLSFAYDSLSIQKQIKIAPLVELDHRFSLVNQRFSHIWGVRSGVVINNQFKTNIRVNTEDILDGEGLVAGTKVSVLIPHFINNNL